MIELIYSEMNPGLGFIMRFSSIKSVLMIWKSGTFKTNAITVRSGKIINGKGELDFYEPGCY